jgi:dTDP-4-amino-4,6-dideoxygalactose transaminase
VPKARLAFPLDNPTVTLFARARHALLAGVMALGLAVGDEVLVPAYHHGSEIEALAVAGCALRFYDATESLEPSVDELESLVSSRTRALYVTHYLGFPQDVKRWRAWCDQRGLLLLEDAAQAWLASSDDSPVGMHGDLAVFCLYKTFGLPDGAALITRSASVTSAGNAPRAGTLDFASLARRHAAWLASRSGLLGALTSVTDRAGEYLPERDFALGEVRGPARGTLRLLRRLGDDAADRRRSHYRALLDDLATDVPAPFDELAAGASPFGLPVSCANKYGLLEHAAGHGIQALDFWSVPHPLLPVDRFPGAAARRATTVVFPSHQELQPSDLQTIIDVVRPWKRLTQS